MRGVSCWAIANFSPQRPRWPTGIETHVCLSVEQGISTAPLIPLLEDFIASFPNVSVEISTPSPADSAARLREGATDIGVITEQEGYPAGFQFRGIGYSRMIAICAPGHPLATGEPASYRDLRQHRQVLRHRNPVKGTPQQYEKKSAKVWHVENPNLILDIVKAGQGWAEIPISLAAPHIARGDLVAIDYAFQQNDLLEGIDLVWTEHRALGVAGRWLRDAILKLPQRIWQTD